MKNLYRLLLLLALAPAAALAQSAGIPDSVSTGASYADQVFYSFESGVVGTAPADDWDIAFETSGFGAGVITNGGSGVALYHVPNSSSETFGRTLDTTGMAAAWGAHHNSTASWGSGAFNMGVDPESGDFGWGTYSTITHAVNASAVFVIRLVDGSFKQIIIDELAARAYTFRWADLDGANVRSATVAKDAFPGKLFGYFNLRTAEAVDREPDVHWDLTFGTYVAMIGDNGDIPYVVSGVRANTGVEVAEVSGVPFEQVRSDASSEFSAEIAAIGHDWKTYAGTWSIAETVYLVRNINRAYKLQFTGFGGAGTGTYHFVHAAAGVSAAPGGRADRIAATLDVRVHDGAVRLVLDRPHADGPATLAIYDLRGEHIATADLSDAVGRQRVTMPVPTVAGAYVAVLAADGVTVSRTFIVR